eukprot:640634-Alexandrium_andersonii.AAC.1
MPAFSSTPSGFRRSSLAGRLTRCRVRCVRRRMPQRVMRVCSLSPEPWRDGGALSTVPRPLPTFGPASSLPLSRSADEE